MEEKTKLVGMLALSFSLVCMALAIGYVGYGLSGWLKQLPAILSLVEDTSVQIAPVLENVTEVEHLIPPIMEEVAAVRKTVDNTVAEVENIRKATPGILADLELVTREVDNTVSQLPGIIDPVLAEVGKTRETIPGVLEEVRLTRETIPDVLEEVRLTREALPGLMDRADQLVASAGEAGQQAGKGAMTGMVGGIISMPFGIVGGIGKGIAGLAGLEGNEAVTEKDLELLREKVLDLAENGEEGDVDTWKNKKTSNSGKITLLRKYVENDLECREVKVETFIKGQDAHVQTIDGCKQPDGSWIAIQ